MHTRLCTILNAKIYDFVAINRAARKFFLRWIAFKPPSIELIKYYSLGNFA